MSGSAAAAHFVPATTGPVCLVTSEFCPVGETRTGTASGACTSLVHVHSLWCTTTRAPAGISHSWGTALPSASLEAWGSARPGSLACLPGPRLCFPPGRRSHGGHDDWSDDQPDPSLFRRSRRGHRSRHAARRALVPVDLRRVPGVLRARLPRPAADR